MQEGLSGLKTPTPPAGDEKRPLRPCENVGHQKRGLHRLLQSRRPETFFDSFQYQTKDPATSNRPQDTMEDNSHIPSSGLEKGSMDRYDPDNCPRGRDLERLTRAHDNRGQVLHAVAAHTQLSERDKSRSPLKPTPAPP
ncbi:hypothetical protein NDU88_010833 [Pleurodeles waltl]|uniref:Uncharacterized protein n=1 Tax=Pleurodeles waltl TaxID=8319 RepID=A0AAV7QZB5_PLEWA|nr:hypothetical protein NDU88_010833 [Pleurodeles waltl]